LLDNADIFYLENYFSIKVTNIANTYIHEISLNFSIENKQEIEQRMQQVSSKVDEIINTVITDNMNDFEKELAIHDYLVNTTKYYEYKDIKEIPQEKHNVYSTLIENEAVCDGFSKAFQLLLQNVGINVITVTGRTNSSAHAWNKVRLDNEWYNVDVTSDTVTNEKHIVHVYFNLTDDEISSTHKFNGEFFLPKSESTKYNYYKYMGYEINSNNSLGIKLSSIISKNNTCVLEFKVINNSYDKQEIVNKLYDLNFSNYKKNNMQNIEYYLHENVYIFVNRER